MAKQKTKRYPGVYARPDSEYLSISWTDGGRRVRETTRFHKDVGEQAYKDAAAYRAKLISDAYKKRKWEVPDDEPAKQYLFGEMIMQYLNSVTPKKRAPDRDDYSAKHLYPHFTGKDMATMRPSDIDDYIETRSASPGTINKEIGLLSSAWNYAKRRHNWPLPENPCAGKRAPEPEHRTRWITRPEAAALIRAAQSEPQAPHLPDFIVLALHTGMRRGEMLNLEWRSIDLQRNMINLEAGMTKSGKGRPVPLNATAQHVIRSRRKFVAEHCPDSPYVFCRTDGNRIASVKKSFTTACRRAGLADLRVHDLRHTCATWLAMGGTPMHHIAALLGHSTTYMTERYAHHSPDAQRTAVDSLDLAQHQK